MAFGAASAAKMFTTHFWFLLWNPDLFLHHFDQPILNGSIYILYLPTPPTLWGWWAQWNFISVPSFLDISNILFTKWEENFLGIPHIGIRMVVEILGIINWKGDEIKDIFDKRHFSVPYFEAL